MEYDKYRPTNVFLASAFCGTVFALESANIVGYTELALNAGGKNMVGPCFVNTGSTTIKLSDIEVTGYENSDYYMWTDMAAPVVVVQRRASNGQPYAQYSWSAEFDGENWLDGSWVKDIGDDNDPVLKPGDALWVQTPDLEDCTAFNFKVSGEVMKGSIGFELNAGGKISVCNPSPVACKLSDVEVQGYQNSDYYMWTDMAAPVVVIQKLLSNGQPERQYSWSAEFDGENWLDGSWVKDIGDVSAADWSLAPGEGMWVQCPDLEDCEKFTMVFPAAL